jgi:Icc-related predicted phosphoesterase
MRIWHISDTHGHHKQLVVPKNIDMVIHSGDASNYKDPYRNEAEMRDFVSWMYKLPIEHKVFVAGNHDTSVEKGLVHPEDIKNLGISYLYMETIEIAGFKIWGSPYCPRYGDWAFMKGRDKMMSKVWDFMDMSADIIITHTAPMYILDATSSRIFDPSINAAINVIKNVGCKSLYKKILEAEPILHCFGHIHGSREVKNSGTKKLSGVKTLFSNGSCCADREKDRFKFNGNIIEIFKENQDERP